MTEKINQNYVGLTNLPTEMQKRIKDGRPDETIVETGKRIKMGGDIFMTQGRVIKLFDVTHNNGQGCILHGAITQGESARIVSVEADSKGAARYAFGLIHNVSELKAKYSPRVEKKGEVNSVSNEVD